MERNEAIEIVKKNWSNDGFTRLYEALETLIPELAESEDERIRKELIDYFNKYKEKEECGVKTFYGIPTNNILAWLEKQGEQKSIEWHSEDEQNLNVCLSYIPDEFLRRWLKDVIHVKYDKAVNKVEPKFKVGDWLQYRNAKPFLVEEITQQGYVNGISCLPFEWENEIHLWSIQDAKDGDVLASEDKDKIFIYNGKLDLRGRVCAYCGIYKTYDGLRFTKCAIGNYFIYKKPHPATKEQRDLLFQKMKEEGYEWDAEKKEIKEIDEEINGEDDENMLQITCTTSI